MEQFRKGDFILLRNTHDYIFDDPFCKGITVFEIQKLSNGYAEVENCKKKVPMFDLEPILISNKYDNIYYDSDRVPMASLIHTSGNKPEIGGDKPKPCYYENDQIQMYIKSNNFKYVHELQHFLCDKEYPGKLCVDIIYNSLT